MHAQTRERLIATAQRLFLTVGYNATSLEQVASEAGYSRGAVYSNFADKCELGLVVLDAVRLDRATSLVAAVTAATSPQECVTACAAWADQYLGDEGWSVLEVEFAASSRHIDGVREQLITRRRQLTDALAAGIAAQAQTLGVELKISAADLALRLLALGIGLGVQRAIDPELPVDALVDLVREAIGDV
jgi:AcrR family transcriptional regulator